MAKSASEMLSDVETVLDRLSLAADGFAHRVLRWIQMDARKNGLRQDGWTFSEVRLREIAGRDSEKLPRLLKQLGKRGVHLVEQGPHGYRFPKLDRIVVRRAGVANAVSRVKTKVEGLANPVGGIKKTRGNPPSPSPAASPALFPSPTSPIPIPTPITTPNRGSRAPEEKPVKRPGKPDPAAIPAALDTPEFRAAWVEWQQHRREIRETLTPTTVRRQLAKLEKFGVAGAVASIGQSIENGWTGLFEPRGERRGLMATFEESPEETARKAMELFRTRRSVS